MAVVRLSRFLTLALSLWIGPGLASTLATGCSSSESAAPIASDVDADAGTSTPRRDASDEDAEATCDPSAPITVYVDEAEGMPSRLHVPASVDGKKGVMLFDTGSTHTFISVPQGSKDPVPNAGTLTVGNCSELLMGRPYAAEESRGLPGLGYFGVDQIVAAPRAVLDLSAGSLTRFFEGTGPATEGWSTTKLEVVAGSLLVRMKLSGKDVRLLVDTGAPHILWLGQEMQPGDIEERTTDAVGNELSLFRGTVDAEFTPGTTETIPVLRVPSFPYLESRRKEFGGELDGLLGLSAFGPQTLFDSKGGAMKRAPAK